MPSNSSKVSVSGHLEDKFLTASKAVYEMTSSDLDIASFKLHILDQLTNSGRIDDNTASRIKLCFQEALTNSLDHGNLELESKWKDQLDENGIDLYSKKRQERLADAKYSSRIIFVDAEFDGSKLQIVIKDQGKGFDTNKQIREAAKNMDNHGRGLFLMNKILDQVVYSKGGTEVLLVKKINGR